MGNTSMQKPSRMEQARQRLERAVARVEAALDARVNGDDAGITEELETLRATNAALQETRETVLKRIDGTIDRLKTILEN